MTTVDHSDRMIQVDRLIAAPRDLVFQMLTEARHLDQWWGPDGFITETHEMDFSVGGPWRYTMHGPDKDWPNWIRYTESRRPSGSLMTTAPRSANPPGLKARSR